MNKILISLLMALTLVVGFASASLTAPNVAISVAQGNDATGTLTLTAADNASITNIVSSDLTGSSIFIDDAEVSFDSTTFDMVAGESKNVSISINSASNIQGTYDGTITVSYDNGSNETLPVPISLVINPSNVGAFLEVSNVDFGKDLERSWVEEDEIKTHSETFTIRNTGTEALIGITFSTNLDSDFDVNFSENIINLGVGQSKEISMSLIVPIDTDSGVLEGKKLTVSDDDGNSWSSDILMELENYLSVSDIDVEIEYLDGSNEDDSLNDGDTFNEDVHLGDELTIKVTVDNDNSYDIDIEDVEVEIENDEMDADDDLKEDIDEGDNYEFEFTFTVDEDADEGTETLDITVTGTDDEGAKHKLELSIDFDIQDLEDFISIEAIDFPSTVRCGDTARLEVDIENIGTSNQRDASVRVDIPQWDFLDWERNIRIDDGDDDTIVFSVNIPSDIREGSYFGEVEAFYDGDEKTDEDSFDFQVICGDVSNDDNEEDEEEDDTVIFGDNDEDQTSGNDNTNNNSGSITAVGKESFFESTGYLILLTVLVVILIVVIVGLLLMGKHKA